MPIKFPRQIIVKHTLSVRNRTYNQGAISRLRLQQKRRFAESSTAQDLQERCDQPA